MAAVGRCHRAQHTNTSVAAIDFDLHRNCAIAGGIFVSGKADPAATTFAFLPFRPAESLGSFLYSLSRAFVFEETQAIFDRVDIGRARQFVDEGFNSKDISVSAKAARRGNAQRHFSDEMRQHLLARKLIERHAIAVCSKIRRAIIAGNRHFERLFEIARREQIARCATRPCAMRCRINIEIPVEHIAVFVEPRFRLENHGGTIGLPAMLAIARILNAHRAPRRCLRQQSCIGCSIVCHIVPIAA